MPTELASLCVFCGSRPGTAPVYRQQAEVVGRELATREIRLVFGGGSVGLMGAVCDAVLAAGGQVTGVLPEFLATRELRHFGVSDMRVVHDMHARKALMAELSDAFLALPGGYGTFEELFEIITWAQLGLHGCPIGLLNTSHFFDPLVAMIDRAVEEGFIRPAQREHDPPPQRRWLNPEQT